jgi:hypothetical protein
MAQGVGTPLAAAVRIVQVPNGGMLVPGLKSMIVAAQIGFQVLPGLLSCPAARRHRGKNQGGRNDHLPDHGHDNPPSLWHSTCHLFASAFHEIVRKAPADNPTWKLPFFVFSSGRLDCQARGHRLASELDWRAPRASHFMLWTSIWPKRSWLYLFGKRMNRPPSPFTKSMGKKM